MKTREDYAKFLESDFWIKLSLACRARAKFICYRCGKRAGKKHCQAHHVRYPDDWYQTTLDDLICLCRKCHEKQHGIVKARPEPADIQVKEPEPQLPEILGLKELYQLRSKRKISRQEFRKRRAELRPGNEWNKIEKSWKKKKPKKHRNHKHRVSQFETVSSFGPRKYHLNIYPRFHWVNRGTSSN